MELPAQMAIQDALKKFKKDSVMLMIVHHPSFINIADQFYPLDDGAVVAHGSPEEIREKPQLFEKLFPKDVAG